MPLSLAACQSFGRAWMRDLMCWSSLFRASMKVGMFLWLGAWGGSIGVVWVACGWLKYAH